MEWITTDDVKKETWRRLLEFANDDFAIAKIEELHGPITNKNEVFYKKQARQIRLCLLQAKDYLNSSNDASLITAPNLVYYSAVSLCSATMLLNGSGEKSLDYLRNSGKSRSHGMSRSVEESRFSEGTRLLEQVSLKVQKEGFLKEWYETIPKVDPHYTVFHRYDQEGSVLSGIGRFSFAKFIDFEELVGEEPALIDLVKRVPDLENDLRRLGIATGGSRLSEKVEMTDQRTLRKWIIHKCESEVDLDKIISEFTFNDNPDGIEFKKHIAENKLSAVISIEYDSKTKLSYKSPESRWTSDGIQFCYPGSFTTPEIVDCFGILYLIGMICRYYPDLWITTLDKHSLSSKILEGTIEVMKKKFPILALSLLNQEKIIISPHLPHWQVR